LAEGGGVVAGADASGHDHDRLGQPAVAQPAATGDTDGLKYVGWLPPAAAQLPDPGFGQNFLGLGIAFWPLISTTAGAVAGDGAAVELAVDAAGIGVVAGMAALPWFRVEHVILYGGEIDVQSRPDGVEALVLVDVEAAISADVSIGSVDIASIDRKNPLIVRYKAIGFIIGNKAGEAKFPFRPYFDSSKGYTIDVSKPGAIQVHDPFDKILKILGARLSRNNPFYVEVDLGFAVDLGVVSIDRACVRLNLSPGGPPEITAFGASVDIPGALKGSGYAQVGTDAQGNSVIAGAMDLTITPVNVRIAATLAVAQISAQNGGPATGIQVSLEVDFPVAIPLADSGLGIYGFVGLFAMNFQRDPSLVTDTTVTAPALAWLKATHGDVANPKYWVPNINSWAFGVGALLGTEGTDIILNMKGMVLLELPGPNLLIMMKANVLFPMPELQGDAGQGPAGVRRLRLRDAVRQRYPGAQQPPPGHRLLDRGGTARCAVGGDGLTCRISWTRPFSTPRVPSSRGRRRRSGSTFRSGLHCRPSSSCAGCSAPIWACRPNPLRCGRASTRLGRPGNRSQSRSSSSCSSDSPSS
jgi:large repetitive protein